MKTQQNIRVFVGPTMGGHRERGKGDRVNPIPRKNGSMYFQFADGLWDGFGSHFGSFGVLFASLDSTLISFFEGTHGGFHFRLKDSDRPED